MGKTLDASLLHSCVPLQISPMFHDIAYSTAAIEAEY